MKFNLKLDLKNEKDILVFFRQIDNILINIGKEELAFEFECLYENDINKLWNELEILEDKNLILDNPLHIYLAQRAIYTRMVENMVNFNLEESTIFRFEKVEKLFPNSSEDFKNLAQLVGATKLAIDFYKKFKAENQNEATVEETSAASSFNLGS